MLEQYISGAKSGGPQGTELTAPDGGNGLQITLYNDSGGMTLPYWHEGERAEAVLSEAQSFLVLLRDGFGMYAYDMQIGIVIESAPDRAAQYRVYEPHVHRVRKLGEDLD